MTFRIPLEVVASIEAIPEAANPPRSYVIVRALKTYFLNEGADILAEARGPDQIAVGEYEDFDDVAAVVDKIIAGHAA